MSPDQSFFKSFTDEPNPPILYIDTTFIVDAIVEGQEHHEKSLEFIEKLAKDSKTQPIIIYSDLLRIEFRCAIIGICIRNKYDLKDKSIHDLIKAHPDVIKEFYPEVEEAEKQFQEILQRFVHRTSVEINEDIIKKSGDLMQRYRLGSYDAVHVATMEFWGIKDIVSYDWSFGDLPKYKPDCKVWSCHGFKKYNDRISKRKDPAETINKIIQEAEAIVET